MAKSKKRRHARREEDVTLARLLTEAFAEKVSGTRGRRPLYQYVADHMWEQVLLGKRNAYRNWQRFRQFATTFDDVAPRVIRITGGLSDPSEQDD